MNENNLDISHHMKDLGAFHIDSFNYLVNGIKNLISDIDPVYTRTHIKINVSIIDCSGLSTEIFLQDIYIKQLQYPMELRKRKWTVFPSETRLQEATYNAELHLQLKFQKKNEVAYFDRIFYVPVMVKSDLCFLKGLTEEELIKVKEDINDPGGYFIVKGKERIFRHFVVPKRNYPLAIIQPKWKSYRKDKRLKHRTEYGVKVRSVKDEFVFSNMYIHLLHDGGFEVRFFCNSTVFYVQLMLILKALTNNSDNGIVNNILKYDKDFPDIKLKNMLRTMQNEGILSSEGAKDYLGRELYPVLNPSQNMTYCEAADFFFRKSLLVHLDSNEEKYEFLCFAVCKLQCAYSKKCAFDDIDNPVNQEILSTGQIYYLILKDGIVTYLKSVKCIFDKIYSRVITFSGVNFKKCANDGFISFTPKVASSLATGNFNGRNWGLTSDTGYTIALKRTNLFELVAQFTAVWKFSMEHIPKNARKFYPESWGFLCPTQTPEGENTGLKNYLSSESKIVNLSSKRINENILFQFGVISCADPHQQRGDFDCSVVVDGKIIGWIKYYLIGKLLYMLKKLKSLDMEVPYHTEIAYIAENELLYPGIYIFSSPCRFVRKILNRRSNMEEYLGMFEQVCLSYILRVMPGDPCYSEVSDASFLSLSSRMIPFCDHNYPVRNIYSSEKCKQALGLPFLNFDGRSDSKVFQLMYGQSPIVSTKMYSKTDFDFYPFGTNVVVAILCYSGYDMEDALVLNKASVERGLMQNMVYKTTVYDLKELQEECGRDLEFKRNEEDPSIAHFLDENGIPHVGVRVQYNDPILSVYDKTKDQYIIKSYLERNDSFVHAVRLMDDVPCSTKNIPKYGKKLSITFCIKSEPKVGDKFTNRHGGKGVCGGLMRSEDLPFTGDGLVPDILFNPHGIPSRQPIGMLFEMAAAKASIYKGSKYIVEPFESRTSEVYEEIGDALTDAGFSYYGTETFYSGTSGEELTADVFCGTMFYMRLHHLVEEKYQVQSIGPVDEKTNQPINPGRSGAVRFGEMERDAILSHGAMELTLDRLLINSDKCIAYICESCHMLIPPTLQDPYPENRDFRLQEMKHCNLCQRDSEYKVQIPYPLVYLMSELAVMNIKVRLLDK